jgi:hypothetical protein
MLLHRSDRVECVTGLVFTCETEWPRNAFVGHEPFVGGGGDVPQLMAFFWDVGLSSVPLAHKYARFL